MRTVLLDSENLQKINAVCNDSVSLIFYSSDTRLLLLILLRGRAQVNVWRYTVQVLTDQDINRGASQVRKGFVGS